MKIVTVATSEEGYYKWLKMSCERYNTDLITLGMNQKWLGYNWKLIKMKEYLDNISDEEIVMFIDAYDVILLDDPVKLEEKFINSNKKIIIGCESKNRLATLGMFVFDTCKGENVNSGTYIGYNKDLKIMLNKILKENKDPDLDDQKLIIKYCNINKNEIHIDKDSEFFTVKIMGVLEDVDIDIENNKSFVLHAPGNTRMEKIIRKLNYNISLEEEEQLTLYHYRTLKRKAKYYLLLAKNFVLMFIITIAIIYLYFL